MADGLSFTDRPQNGFHQFAGVKPDDGTAFKSRILCRPSAILPRSAAIRVSAFSAGGEAFDSQANVQRTGRLSDISRSGCYMDTISPFAVNAAVILTVTRDGRTFKTKAKVVYSLNGMGMG